MAKTKSKTKTKAEPTPIASRSNHNLEYANGLYAWRETLYFAPDSGSPDGDYFLSREVGPALRRTGPRREYIGRHEAVAWIATEATDPTTGYGYTAEQAELMADGLDAGKGWRDDGE